MTNQRFESDARYTPIGDQPDMNILRAGDVEFVTVIGKRPGDWTYYVSIGNAQFLPTSKADAETKLGEQMALGHRKSQVTVRGGVVLPVRT